MNALIIALALAGLQDPSAVTMAIHETPDGLLCTDGRHAGLYIADSDGELDVLSDQPGAGRNVVRTCEGILFKECPPGRPQRVVSITDAGERLVLFEGDYFSGPFECGSGTFLIAETDRITEYSFNGEALRSWPARGFSAWLASLGEGGGQSFSGNANDLKKRVEAGWRQVR